MRLEDRLQELVSNLRTDFPDIDRWTIGDLFRKLGTLMHTKDHYVANFTDFLFMDEDFQCLKDCYWVSNLSLDGFSRQTLPLEIIKSALHGSDINELVSEHRVFARCRNAKVQYYFAVAGSELTDTHQIADGVRILPWSEVRESVNKTRLSRYIAWFPGGGSIETAQAELVIQINCDETFKIVPGKDPPTRSRADELSSDEVKQSLQDTSQDIIRCVFLDGGRCVDITGTWREYEQILFNTYMSDQFNFFNSFFESSSFLIMSTVDPARVAQLYLSLSSANDPFKRAMRLAIDRLNGVYRRRNSSDRILDIAVALEIMLLQGADRELSYRLSLNGATLLGGTAQNRTNNFRLLRDVYDLRSTVAHGNRSDKRKKKKKKERTLLEIDNIVYSGYKLAIEIALKLIQHHEFPDWEKMYFLCAEQVVDAGEVKVPMS